MDGHQLVRNASMARPPSVARPTSRRLATSAPFLTRRQQLLSLAVVGLTPLLGQPSIAAAVAQAPSDGKQQLAAAGIRCTDVKSGSGPKIGDGELVIIDVVGKTESGQVFLDTRESGSPLAFEVGRTNKYITAGLSQVVASMSGGDVKQAVVPASLGYGDVGQDLPQGSVPPNAKLVYEVEVLRCQNFTMGLACCSEASFPCIGKDSPAAKREAEAAK